MPVRRYGGYEDAGGAVEGVPDGGLRRRAGRDGAGGEVGDPDGRGTDGEGGGEGVGRRGGGRGGGGGVGGMVEWTDGVLRERRIEGGEEGAGAAGSRVALASPEVDRVEH